MNKTKDKPQQKTKERELSWKQNLFVEEYIANSGNATVAARKAGYKGNDNTLAQTGLKQVRKGKILNAIQAKTAVITQKIDKKLIHDRETALLILHEALAMARLKKDNQGIVSACRELNEISGLHDSAGVIVANVVQHLTEAEELAALELRLNRLNRLNALPSAIDKQR